MSIKIIYMFAILSSIKLSAQEPRPLIRTDIDRVLQSGQLGQGNRGSSEQALVVNPGLYDIFGSGNINEYYLLVEPYANDPRKFLAVLFPRQVGSATGQFFAWFYQGRPILGSGLMLSPLLIDLMGNVSVASEMGRDAPVVQVTRAGENSTELLLQGRNGALNGQLLRMRLSSHRRPALRPLPSSREFQNRAGLSNIVVDDRMVSYHNAQTRRDSIYQLVPLNGDAGTFSGLIQARLDTMAESLGARTEIRQLAMFLSGLNNEKFIVATPDIRTGDGSFRIDVYQAR